MSRTIAVDKRGQVGLVAPVARAKGVQLQSLPQMPQTLRDTISGASVWGFKGFKLQADWDCHDNGVRGYSQTIPVFQADNQFVYQSFSCFPRYS